MYKQGLSEGILRGNLTGEVELKYTTAGTARGKGSIAINEMYKDSQGVLQQHTSFFNIVMWGATAENAAAHLVKGQEVTAVGRWRQDSFENDEGKIVRYIEFVVRRLDYGDKPGWGKKNAQADEAEPASDQPVASDEDKVEVPF